MSNYYITPQEYAIAEKNGINRNTLNLRVREYAWDKEKAISTPPRKKRTNISKDIKRAKDNGRNVSTFLHRIKNGWGVEEAIDTPPTRTKKYSKDIYETLEKNGISQQLFNFRIKKGWDFNEALTSKPNLNRKKRVAGV